VQLTSPEGCRALARGLFSTVPCAKVLRVQSAWLPGWVLPVAEGTLAAIGVLWYISAM